jgi:hypothetical protein
MFKKYDGGTRTCPACKSTHEDRDISCAVPTSAADTNGEKHCKQRFQSTATKLAQTFSLKGINPRIDAVAGREKSI